MLAQNPLIGQIFSSQLVYNGCSVQPKIVRLVPFWSDRLVQKFRIHFPPIVDQRGRYEIYCVPPTLVFDHKFE